MGLISLPPYEQFSDAAGDETWLDGWELWRRRGVLLIPEASFPEIPATEPADLWQSDQLSYHAEFTVEGHTYTADRHPGGHVDWYTVDGDAPFPPRAALGDPEISAFPAQLTYPGVPSSRFWQIENAAVDLGGYPPDTSHFPSMLLTDLFSSHGTQWFLFPITTVAGSTVTVEKVVVTDGFGEQWSSVTSVDADAHGLVPVPGAVRHEGGLHDSARLAHRARSPCGRHVGRGDSRDG